MNRCPITYKTITSGLYSPEGLAILSKRLNYLNLLPLSKEEQIQQAVDRMPKMSIQGVKPKLSAVLNTRKSLFEIVDKNGIYILKPQSMIYEQLPENEDLTMKLAAAAGIEVPLHGMIYSKDNSLTYFIKRFDRLPKNNKLPLEDFAQLSGFSRETKYDSSMEKVVRVIDQYCTFPFLEKIKLFSRTIFNFLTGNEDMHLKNFSLITRINKTELSPAYDFLNTTIAIKNPREELALPLRGRKRNISRKDLIDYFGIERLGLNIGIIQKELDRLSAALPEWTYLIENSFLNDTNKQKYLELLMKRVKILGI